MNHPITMTAHDLRVNGITLHYCTWGEFTRPERAVLLVHGLTASSQSWTSYGPHLAEQGWYVIAPDLRGRGLSEKPPHGYGLPFHVNDLLSLCDELSLPRVHLVGHSLGALIGYFFAAIHPARLGRLVLVDAGGKIPEDALQALASSLQRLGQVYPSLDAYLAARRQSAVYPWTPFWEAYYRYDALVHPDGTVTSRIPKAVIDEEIAANFLIRTEMLPSAVRAPTLIVRAALGTLGPDRGFLLPAEEAERICTAISDSRRIDIPDTNHYTIALSEVFMRETLAFLAAETAILAE
jgi:pimeloyl-ACP methyl ester carboxylesterase